jgi:hypothetical protein
MTDDSTRQGYIFPTPPTTPLADFLRIATPAERERCAVLAGTSVSYLYQLAGCHRKRPSAELALLIEDATRTLSKESNGRLPTINARTVATMCAVMGLG